MKKNLFKVVGLGLTIAGFAYDLVKDDREKEELKSKLKEEILDEIKTTKEES